MTIFFFLQFFQFIIKRVLKLKINEYLKRLHYPDPIIHTSRIRRQFSGKLTY